MKIFRVAPERKSLMSEHKYKHKKHKISHNSIKTLAKAPKVKIKTHGKLKQVSFTVSRPNWGKRVN